MFEILAITIGSVAGIFVIVFGGRGLVDLGRAWSQKRVKSAQDQLESAVDGVGNQAIRFCTAVDGVRIAYATVGQGPPLVKVANWLTHLEFDWHSPVWSHWWKELSIDHQLVRYDERGCGLSDWSAKDLSFDAWVSDLESVVDALNLDRFALLGISQGGPVAIEYAVRHPERVSQLLLYGTHSKGRASREGYDPEEFAALLTLVRHGWGRDDAAYRQIFTSRFLPEGTGTQIEWFNELQRVSTSPDNASRLLQEFAKVDIRHRLPEVVAPTLILHSRDDAVVPFDEGRQLAASIPGAKFSPLEGKNHILMEDEPAWRLFLSEVRSFLNDGD